MVNVGKPRMPAEFRIDWNYGYSLYDTQTNECIWKYRYSQLKGSSDDGISSLKLLFRDEKTGGIETRVCIQILTSWARLGKESQEKILSSILREEIQTFKKLFTYLLFSPSAENFGEKFNFLPFCDREFPPFPP